MQANNNTKIDKLKVLCLNADMLTNKLPEFELIVKENSPDIIGVNEVLPKSYNRTIYAEEFQISGYEMIHHKNISENTGRGSIIYIKNGLTNKEITINPGKDSLGNVLEDFEESIIIEIPLAGYDKLIYALIYRRGQHKPSTTFHKIS